MTDTFRLTHDALEALFAALREDGRRLLAPMDVEGRVDFGEVRHPAEASKGHIQTVLSAKGLVFPRVERLFSYTLAPGNVTLRDAEPVATSTVVFGLRPCEARAFAALDAVCNWDTRDRSFNAHMDELAIIGVSCTEADEACFCTSVGGGPADVQGSDILLTPTGTGYLAEVLTGKGRAIQALVPGAFVPEDSVDKATLVARVEVAFDQPALTAGLPGLFERGLWDEQALRCLGCGACAYVCPTCACFDIQEEADPRQGSRLRCWDSCGFSMFTLHASGHNPRETQGARWRQRVYHKFSTYPERHGRLGCVGCGKCTRACPVDMNLKEHLVECESVLMRG